MRWETDGSEENRRGWLCPIIRGWLTDYAILKKKIVKKNGKNNNEESFVQSGKKIVLMLRLTNC